MLGVLPSGPFGYDGARGEEELRRGDWEVWLGIPDFTFGALDQDAS